MSEPSMIERLLALQEAGEYKQPTKPAREPKGPKSNEGLAAWSAGFNDTNMVFF